MAKKEEGERGGGESGREGGGRDLNLGTPVVELRREPWGAAEEGGSSMPEARMSE